MRYPGKHLIKLFKLLLILISAGLFAQEEEITETERMKALVEEHKKTGVEFTVQYPLPLYFPGWSYDFKTQESGPLSITYMGTNISYLNMNLGMDMDLGSRKKVLRYMTAGISLEYNYLAPWNMEGHRASLIQYYTYLTYSRPSKKLFDSFIRFGLGTAAVTNKGLFDTQQEKESPYGPLFVLETGTVYPPLGKVRLYSGFSYKFLPVNSRNIHMIAPFIRAGYRL